MDISERYDVVDDDTVTDVAMHSHYRQIGNHEYLFVQVTTNSGTTVLVSKVTRERVHIVHSDGKI